MARAASSSAPGRSLTCYLPDKRTVLVEQRPLQEPLLAASRPSSEQTASFYDIKEVARTRLNRRDTHLITVTPKDEFRYGYRLWIDDKTAMPLKTQLCDADGQVIEQIVFASLTCPSHIPDAAFKPEVSTGLPVAAQQWRAAARSRWARHAGLECDAPAAGIPHDGALRADDAGLAGPVDHLVFSDGLASVSVFVEIQSRAAPARPQVAGVGHVGSSSAFSTVVDGHKVTAVGEVPPATVRFIAAQVKARGGPARPLGARGR